MSGYQGKDKTVPSVSETPQLTESRRKEDLEAHQLILADLNQSIWTAKEALKSAEKAIASKQAEFDAMVLENNSKLQGIQTEIRVAWDDLRRKRGLFSERVKEVEADLASRLAVMDKKEDDHEVALLKLRLDNSAIVQWNSELQDLKIKLAALDVKLRKSEDDLKKSIRLADDTLEANQKETARLEDKNKHLNELSLKLDSERVRNTNERDRILLETEKLSALAKKVVIDQAEYDRVKKLVEDTEKTQFDFNARGNWLADKDAELKTYEKALRIRDAKIQEREGKVQTAEKKIAGANG